MNIVQVPVHTVHTYTEILELGNGLCREIVQSSAQFECSNCTILELGNRLCREIVRRSAQFEC